MVFSSNHQDGKYELYRMNEDGADLRRLTWNKLTEVSPRFDPLGRHLAFISNRPLTTMPERKDPHIWIHDFITGDERLLVRTNPNGEDTHEGITLDWSPDGQFVYFTAMTGPHRQIFRIPATGGAAQPITNFEGDSIHPDVVAGRILHAIENEADVLIQIGGTGNE
jgi:TolB protein